LLIRLLSSGSKMTPNLQTQQAIFRVLICSCEACVF
jgi:hypothetical protein